MNINFFAEPGACDWVPELYRIIQEVKNGTFDTRDVYSQFAALIVPEVVLQGGDGPFTAFMVIRAPDANSLFSFLSPIREIDLWTSVGGVNGTLMISIRDMNLSFDGLVAVTSATDLEKLMFREDDYLSYAAQTPDTRDDVVRTWAGNDVIDVQGSGGTDRFYGGNGNDRITILDFVDNTLQGVEGTFFGYGGAGDDTVQGDQNADHLFGGGDADTLNGLDGRDGMFGGNGNDVLSGGGGNDTLDGGSGADVMSSGTGPDRMTGGSGADTFIFYWNGATGYFDSGLSSGARDVISDFSRGTDKIRPIDFSPGQSGIDLIGSDPFTAPGQVRWISNGTDTTIFINADADRAAEMAITVAGVTTLGAGDFLIL